MTLRLTEMWFIEVLGFFLTYLILTLPSIIYHGLYNIYLIWTSMNKYDTLPPGVHDVIVFVHGRGGHYTNFEPLINSLKAIGTKRQMLAFDLGRNLHTPVQQDVDTLHRQLVPLMDQIESIILVGLSKGGLTATQYGISHPNKIKKVITVSSPLNGTYLANYHPFSPVTKSELGFDSQLCKRIREQSKNLTLFSVVPRFDNVIIPVESAAYPHSKCHYYSGSYSHLGILYDPKIGAIIGKWTQS